VTRTTCRSQVAVTPTGTGRARGGGAPSGPGRRRPRRAAATSGLTLVELMVTLVIASLVSSSAFLFFAGQRRVYDAQIKVLGVQQNLWAAMDTLSRHVRAAGIGMMGCVNTTDPTPTGTTAPQTGLRAYTAGTPGQVLRLAPLWIQNGAAGAPDAITVVFGAGAFGSFSDAGLATSVTRASDPVATAAGKSVGFRVGEFALLLDISGLPAGPPLGDRGCTLFQITGINSAGDQLLHAATSSWNPPGDVANLVPFTYVGGASPIGAVRDFGALSWVRFAIDATGPSPQLTMARLDGNSGPTAPQVLADGIEDLQIAYACDLDPPAPAGPDGILTEGTTAAARATDEWIYNVAGDVPRAGCVSPQAVRLTLSARSTTADDNLAGVPTNAKLPTEDGVAGLKDNFRHRVLTTVVDPRNR
jgi:prepilin-type N-terminal cleavage/methylation domain-containing protein